MKTLAVILLLCAAVQADPVRFGPQQSPKPGDAVRLPDGRTAIYSDNAAERVICTGTCQPQELHRRSERLPAWAWGVGAAAAGGIILSRLVRGESPARTIPPVLPPAVSGSPSPAPGVPVPEPATLILLAGGLLAIGGLRWKR